MQNFPKSSTSVLHCLTVGIDRSINSAETNDKADPSKMWVCFVFIKILSKNKNTDTKRKAVKQKITPSVPET